MRVINIGAYSSDKRLFRQNKTEMQQQNLLKTNDFVQIKSTFYSATSSVSQINFGAKIPFANVRDIPCPCCGTPMLPRKVYVDVTLRTNSAQVDKVGHATTVLSNYTKNMRPVERDVFSLLKSTYLQNPVAYDFQEILMHLRPEYLAKLKVVQFNILKDIEKLNQDFSNGHKKGIQNLIAETRRVINEDKQDHYFKRKTFIDLVYWSLRDLLVSKNESEDKRIAKLIYAKALTLPNSRNNTESFVVKYSRRSHREIVERLLSDSVSTIEHIRAKSFQGMSNYFNYLLQCQACNNERGNMSFYHWTKYHHSQMQEKLKEYLKVVIGIFKADRVKKREDRRIPVKWQTYPKEVTETIYKQSGKKIDLRDFVASLLK